MSESSVHRRRHDRVNLRMTVRISTIDPEADPATGEPCFRTSEETCANVSRGGAFVETVEPVTPGRRILLELDLPGGETVEAVGRVAWARTRLQRGAAAKASGDAGIGIEFLGGSPDHFALLERTLGELVPQRPRRRAALPPPAPSGSA